MSNRVNINGWEIDTDNEVPISKADLNFLLEWARLKDGRDYDET